MTKAELRREARARLAALSRQERDAASAAIGAHLWTVPEVASARTLLLFSGRADEVETDAIAREAVRRGIAIAYPLIRPASGTLTLHRVDGPQGLVDGSHRIREPEAHAPQVAPAEIDAVLVPGLAWDAAGARLGRGAGYFDRLFADPDWRGFRCGLFFACQEMPSVPVDPWDVPLDAVVTERGVVKR